MRKTFAAMFVTAALLVTSFAHADEAPAAPAATTEASTGASASGWFGSGMNDTGAHSRPFQFSIMVGISPFAGFGLVPGIRLDIPILDDGFIPNLNDSLEIFVEVDAALYFGSLLGGFLIGIPVMAGVRWTLYFTDSIAGFVRGGGGISIFPQLFGLGAGIGGGGLGGLGVLFNLGAVTLRVETGYPGVLSVGLTF